MSPESRMISRLVIRRWLLGVFLVGSVVPLGLIAVLLLSRPRSELTAEMVVGRGELYLVSGSAVLTAIISCLDGRPDERLSTEASLVLVICIVLPCFGVWAQGTALGLSSTAGDPLSRNVSVVAGQATAIVSQLVAFGLLLRHARFEVLKRGPQ